MYSYKHYKDMTIDEKINFKSWGYWNGYGDKPGYIYWSMRNAEEVHCKDYADWLRGEIGWWWNYAMPKQNVTKGIYFKLYNHKL